VVVRGGIGSIAHLGDTVGKHLDRSHKGREEVVGRGDVAVPELVGEDRIFFRPIIDYRLVARIPEVGQPRLLLETLNDGGVFIDSRYGRSAVSFPDDLFLTLQEVL